MNQGLKHIFGEDSSKEKAYEKAYNFCQKWHSRCSNIRRYFKLDDFCYYLTYIECHHKIRCCIYTTNSIENLNSKIRKTTRNKFVYEGPVFYLAIIREYQDKNCTVFPVHNFKFL